MPDDRLIFDLLDGELTGSDTFRDVRKIVEFSSHRTRRVVVCFTRGRRPQRTFWEYFVLIDVEQLVGPIGRGGRIEFWLLKYGGSLGLRITRTLAQGRRAR